MREALDHREKGAGVWGKRTVALIYSPRRLELCIFSSPHLIVFNTTNTFLLVSFQFLIEESIHYELSPTVVFVLFRHCLITSCKPPAFQ